MIEQITEKRSGYCRSQHRAEGYQKESVRQHELRVQIFYYIYTEGYEKSHHPQSAEENRKVKHLVSGVGRDAEVEDDQIDDVAEHSSGDEIAETPSLPSEPPETDDGSHNESRYKHQAERIGMYAVYADNAVQIIGNQGTAGTEKHDQYHESVSDDGFMVMEWFQADIWLLLCPLPVDEKVNQYGDGNRINPYFGRGEPI